MKLIIWALFDSHNSCYQKTNLTEIEIISIGLGPGTNHINLNLSSTDCFYKLDELYKIKKPDIIIASPPCESWSTASSIKGRIGNRCWARRSGMPFIPQPEYKNNTETRRNGVNCIVTTINIIERYKPDIYIIENPARGMIWDYIEMEINHDLYFIDNKVKYNNYNYNFSQKPTNFYSNINLSLDDTTRKARLNMQDNIGSYGDRSNIPIQLIDDIFTKCYDYIFNKKK